MENLVPYYEYVGLIHGPTGLVGKICLLVVLLAIWNRQAEKTVGKVFAVVVAAQLLLSAWVAIDFITAADDLGGVGAGPLLLAIVGVVVAGAAVGAFVAPSGRWSVRPPGGARAALGWLVVAWAFYYPVTGTGLFRSIFFSPTTALPHPVLLFLGGIVWMSAPNAHRLVAWATGLALMLVGVVDVFLAGFAPSWVLLALGALVLGDMLKSQISIGSFFEDDEPPVEKEEREKKREFVRKQTKEKTWKLK